MLQEYTAMLKLIKSLFLDISKATVATSKGYLIIAQIFLEKNIS
jgi:hypothetical protein